MVDIEKHVSYWVKGAREDWNASRAMLQQGHIRHALFFVHLSLEKLLKALICRRTGDIAPRIHNLVRLAEIVSLPLSKARIDILAEVNSFNIEGRYPDSLTQPPSLSEAKRYRARAKEVFKWLQLRLQKQ